MRSSPGRLASRLALGLAAAARVRSRVTPSASPVSTSPVSSGSPAQGRFAAQLPGALGGYQYVNRTRNDCGQAAVATARTLIGDWAAPDSGGTDQQARLQENSPPDLARGLWGSSPRLVQRMLGSTRTVSGFGGLEAALGQGQPILVLLDLRPLRRGSGAHWTVVTGLSEHSVQVTNLGGGLVDRTAFADAWKALIPRVAGMASRGILAADTR